MQLEKKVVFICFVSVFIELLRNYHAQNTLMYVFLMALDSEFILSTKQIYINTFTCIRRISYGLATNILSISVVL